MNNPLKSFCVVLALMIIFFQTSAQQSATVTSYGITGKVTDANSGEPLAGVNILIKGSGSGTITDAAGGFSISSAYSPFTLVFSMIGFKTYQQEIQSSVSTIAVRLEEQVLQGQEVVIAASRIEESILKSPVSVEKMNLLDIQNTASDNAFRAIGNLKGVDIVQSSFNNYTVNTRGFNAAGNTRFVQYFDGVDSQAPTLNSSVGNLMGPTELDVASIELIPGASSALYGPNAFNGILYQQSKDPFNFQGLSAYVKSGVNHISDTDFNTEGRGKIGPGSTQPVYEAAIRYAKVINNRFGFKISLSYSKATDWYGTTFTDRAAARTPDGFSFNPGADLVYASGDEVSAPLGLVKLSLAANPVFQGSPLFPLLPFLPNHIVSRTPYRELDVAEYDAYNAKGGAAFHYRLKTGTELSYTVNVGLGSTMINGAQRNAIRDFFLHQHKIELKNNHFFIRAYTTQQDAGDSHSVDFTNILINQSWKSNNAWFQDYSLAYLTHLAIARSAQPGIDLNSIPVQEAAHNQARTAADAGRFLPGTPEYEAAKQQAISGIFPTGSKTYDKTALYHAEAQYDFSEIFKAVSIQTGGSYRMFDLNSNGSIYADTTGNAISVQEYGAYVQASKKLFNEKLKITGSIRYDKNENFDGQFSPRISAVISPVDNHHIRMSYQTGFRNPTLQGQHVDLNAVTVRLLGGLPQYAAAYKAYENAFLQNSVEQFIGAVSKGANPGDPAVLALLEPVTAFDPVKPERVRAYEIGYRNLLGDKLSFDVAYYYSIYDDFIAQRVLRKASGPIDLEATAITPQNAVRASSLLSANTQPGLENTFSIYTNVDKAISAQGLVAGVEYSLPRHFIFSANYNWNRLNEELGDGFKSEYNTPGHKFNIGVGNRKVTDHFGFQLMYRWQQAFAWESTFAKGEVPAFGIADAQVSYRMSKLKSVLRIGGSNIFNERYITNYGGPTLGAVYYVSVTFDQLMR